MQNVLRIPGQQAEGASFGGGVGGSSAVAGTHIDTSAEHLAMQRTQQNPTRLVAHAAPQVPCAPEAQHVVDAAAHGRPVLLVAAGKVQVAARALAKQIDLGAGGGEQPAAVWAG